jgi:hypothetical protein
VIGLQYILQQRYWMIPYAYPALGNPCLTPRLLVLPSQSHCCLLLEEPSLEFQPHTMESEVRTIDQLRQRLLTLSANIRNLNDMFQNPGPALPPW